MTNNKEAVKLKTWYIFIFIMFGMWANTWILQNFVMTREVYHTLLSEQLEISRIDEYFNFVREISIYTYLLSPLVLLIQLTFTTLIVQFPLALKFIDIKFKEIFRITLIAQTAFMLMGIIKTIWLLHFRPSEIDRAILTVTPLSITNLINIHLYPNTALQVLNNFNVFSLVWCFIIIKMISDTGKIKKYNAVILVISVWILMVLFQWVIMAYFTRINS